MDTRTLISLILSSVYFGTTTLAQVSDVATTYMKLLRSPPIKLPSYTNTLTFKWDGPLVIGEQPDVFLLHNQLLGRGFPDDVVAEGKKAAKFFRNMYGPDADFTDVDDALFYQGNITRNGMTFSHFMSNPEAFYRVIAATNMETATRLNNLISNGGWRVRFDEDVQSTGRIQELIPAGSFAVFGNYGIRVGVHADWSIDTQNTEFPGPVMDIHYESDTFIPRLDPVSKAIVVNIKVFNKKIGYGRALGAVIAKVDDIMNIVPGQTIFHGAIVLTFPDALPHGEFQFPA